MKQSFLFLITIMLLFTACREGDAKDSVSEKPYKATTVDECIQERECVWQAFSNQIYHSSYSSQIFIRNYLSKWNRTIKSKVGGNEAKNYIDQYINTAKELAPYIPLEIKVDFLNANYIIIFTDHFNVELEKLLTDLNKNKINSYVVKNLKKKSIEDDRCITLNLSSDISEDIAHSISIINTEHSEYKRCLAVSVYSSFGMTGEIKNQEFSYFNESNSYENFTKLDKFLVYLLYRDEFKSGQKFQTVQKIFKNNFDLLYADFIKENRG